MSQIMCFRLVLRSCSYRSHPGTRCLCLSIVINARGKVSTEWLQCFMVTIFATVANLNVHAAMSQHGRGQFVFAFSKTLIFRSWSQSSISCSVKALCKKCAKDGYRYVSFTLAWRTVAGHRVHLYKALLHSFLQGHAMVTVSVRVDLVVNNLLLQIWRVFSWIIACMVGRNMPLFSFLNFYIYN